MRDKHTFQFTAGKIASAAKSEADYHASRIVYWNSVFRDAKAIVRETASIKFNEVEVTGGTRLQIGVDYGDTLAYQRMELAYSKIASHGQSCERMQTDARVYGSQDENRTYDLDTADVHYYRLGGNPREE